MRTLLKANNIKTLCQLICFGLLLATVPPVVQAATPAVTAKIEKARETVLKGDRTAAIKILKESMREVSRETVNSEILQAWKEIAEVFLTDKGQNQFSLAESFWLLRPKEAADLLVPLLKLEDGNLAVSRLGARASLRALDCVKAETFQTQAELTLPSASEVRLLRLQIQDCANGTSASASALKIPVEADWAELDSAIRELIVKDAVRRKDLKTAKASVAAWETMSTVSGPATDDPELFYWKWRVSPEASRDRTAGRRYVRLCKEMTPRRRKNFAMHPELCLHTETVESDLKSSEKSGL